LKTGVGIPIVSDDKVIAVLEFFMRESRDQNERLVNVIAAVAAQLNLVMEQKRAVERAPPPFAVRQNALGNHAGTLFAG
jgi:GAF domain-containing protein